MKSNALKVTLVLMSLVVGQPALAQLSDLDGPDLDPFGPPDLGWTSEFHMNNVLINGSFYDRYSNLWFDGEDEEEIEEIIVTEKRQVIAQVYLVEMYAAMDWSMLDHFLTEQQSECQAIAQFDPGTICYSEPTNGGGCVTTSYTVATLTQEQADEINAEWAHQQQIDAAAGSLELGIITAIFTGGMSTPLASATSVGVAAGSFAASLPDRDSINPIEAGDSFEITMVTCPSGDGFGEPSSSVSVEYTAG